MRHIIIILILLFIVSCSKPDIYLPRNDNTGLTGINNLSQVYIFFKINKDGDTISDMHKNQIITSTHFVVHIDRRLSIKNLIHDLEWLHKKRFKKSIHYVPGMHLFFSHIDTVHDKLRLVKFDSLEILSPFYFSTRYVKKYPKNYAGLNIIHLNLQRDGLRLENKIYSFPLNKPTIAKEIYRLCNKNRPNYIMLNVDYYTKYERYNDVYGFLVNLDSAKVKLAHKQFWYNPSELKE